MTGSSLGYIPYLPPGALILTAIAWSHELRGRHSENKAFEDVYGHIGGGKRNLFGDHTHFASRALFGNSLAPEAVLLRHTFFGIYSRALPKTTAEKWGATLVEGMRRRNYSKIFMRGKGLQSVTADLRSCKNCIIQDIDESGFPSWRILHMLPPVHHCPHHGSPLSIEIKGKIGGKMWKLGLPTGRSSDMPNQRFEAASDGYVAYLRSWNDLFEGKLPMIAADAWANCIDIILERMGTTENAIGEISKKLSESWNVPSTRLPEILGTHVQQDFLKIELEHRTSPGRIAQKLVILTACCSMGILPAAWNCDEQLILKLPSSKQVNPYSVRERLLRNALLPAGFPLAIAPGLASGLSAWETSKRAGVHRHKVQRAIASLPTAILEELSAHESWGVDSWLSKELLRRHGMKAS